MSEYVREKGEFKIISRDVDKFEKIALDILKEKNLLDRIGDGYTAVEHLRNEFYEDYIINQEFFAEILNYERLDNEYDFCDIVKIDENTFTFHTMYYNGGACMREMIESELENIK